MQTATKQSFVTSGVYTILGALIAFLSGYLSANLTTRATQDAAREGNKMQALVQLKGEQALMNLLIRHYLETTDQFTYHKKWAQMIGDTKGKDFIVEYNGKRYIFRAKDLEHFRELMGEEEKSADKYISDMDGLWQKVYESLALAEKSYGPDAALMERIRGVEALMQDTHHIEPDATDENSQWVRDPNGTASINARDRARVPKIEQYLSPIADLVEYLEHR
jgi:hypothetical protein